MLPDPASSHKQTLTPKTKKTPTPKKSRSKQTPSKCVPPGLLATDIKESVVKWLLPDWIPTASLTLLVGRPGCGKSSLSALLCSLAIRPLLLTGWEESLSLTTIPRLRAHSVPLKEVCIIDPQLAWTFPGSSKRLLEAVRQWGSSLVVLDPIDAYLDVNTNANDGQGVRGMLQELVLIAATTGCAIIGIRHPGKDPNNVCCGSREWAAVPRTIIEVMHDDGPPEKRLIRPYKFSLGARPEARAFTLVPQSGSPPVFNLGDIVDRSEADLAAVTDTVERSKIDRALELLPLILSEGEMLAKEVYAMGEIEKLGDRVLDKAAARMKVTRRREGQGASHKVWWSLPGD